MTLSIAQVEELQTELPEDQIVLDARGDFIMIATLVDNDIEFINIGMMVGDTIESLYELKNNSCDSVNFAEIAAAAFAAINDYK